MKTSLLVIGIAALVVSAGDAGAFAFLGDRWLDPKIPVPYEISSMTNENCITGDEEFDEIRISFQTWQDVPGIRLSFVDTGMTGTRCGHVVDGFNTMSVEDCLGELSGGVLASTSVVNWGGGSANSGDDPTYVGVGTANEAERVGFKDSDIVFADGWRFGTHEDVSNGCCTDNCGCSNSIDIRSIATHEIGHLIGLAHSLVGQATMFATYNPCDTGMASLHADDITATQILYDENYIPVDYKDLNAGNITTSLLNAGNVGVSGSGEAVPGSYGSGFQWPGATQNLYEGALIFGNGAANPVSNDIRTPPAFAIGQDNDFYQAGTVSLSFGGAADQTAQAVFTDEQAPTPYGIRVTASMHAFATPPNDDIIILCYTLENTSGAAINGLRVGFWADWDFNNQSATNSLTYDAVNSLAIVSDAATSDVLGMTVLNPEGVKTMRALLSSSNYTTAQKAVYLFDGFTDTEELNNDINLLIATGDFNIPAGGSANAAFGFVVANSVAALVARAQDAQTLYDSDDFCAVQVIATDEVASPAAPLRLGQNVPNPFNPTTEISFNLERAGMVSLRVYDTSGRLARNLVEGVRLAGEQEVVWDGTDDRGDSLPSGMYFYTLQAGGKTITRKMVLLK